MEALKLAAVALACACVDAPQIEPHSAYHAVCAALKANDRQKPPPSDWDAARRNTHNAELTGGSGLPLTSG